MTLGITEHAQESLGDIVFVELPKEGDRVVATEPYGSVESVKEGTSAGGYCGYTVHNIICTCVQEKGK